MGTCFNGTRSGKRGSPSLGQSVQSGISVDVLLSAACVTVANRRMREAKMITMVKIFCGCRVGWDVFSIAAGYRFVDTSNGNDWSWLRIFSSAIAMIESFF